VHKWGRDREPRSEMNAERVLDLLGCLDEHAIPVWLDGGWGVDALLGRQTRPHDDLDILFELDDTLELEAVLGRIGYVRAHGGPPFSFELVDSEGHQVDAHPVSFKPEGGGDLQARERRRLGLPGGSTNRDGNDPRSRGPMPGTGNADARAHDRIRARCGPPE
jgi:hypothetical protein